MPTIKIAGHDVLIDEEDLHLLLDRKWHVRANRSNRYVQRNLTDGHGYLGCESLHRLITGCEDGMVVDHINGNGLDNRRCNLRVCSHSENMQNRKMHRNNQSGYKGIYFDPDLNGRPWRAQIRAYGRKYNLGRFDTAEEAYAAYLRAAEKLHGEFARAA